MVYNPFVTVGGLPLCFIYTRMRTRMRISLPIGLNFLGASWNYAQSYLRGLFFPYWKMTCIPVFWKNVKYNVICPCLPPAFVKFCCSLLIFLGGWIKYKYKSSPHLYPYPILLFFPGDNCYPEIGVIMPLHFNFIIPGVYISVNNI